MKNAAQVTPGGVIISSDCRQPYAGVSSSLRTSAA